MADPTAATRNSVTCRGSPTFCTPVGFCTLQYTRVCTKVIPWICRIVVLLAYLNCVVAPSDLIPNSLTSKCFIVAQTYPINDTFYMKWNGRNTLTLTYSYMKMKWITVYEMCMSAVTNLWNPRSCLSIWYPVIPWPLFRSKVSLVRTDREG